MIRKYHSHKLQTNPCRRGEEQHNYHETHIRQTKQSNHFILLQPRKTRSCLTERLLMGRKNQIKRTIKIITKQEWTYSNVQQNIEQLQSPTMGVIINNESITTEPRLFFVDYLCCKLFYLIILANSYCITVIGLVDRIVTVVA